MAQRAAADLQPELVRFPPVLNRDDFIRTDYLRSFPDLIGSIHTFTGDDKQHALLLSMLEAGEDWTEQLTPAEVVLTPAACYPVYPMSTGTLPDGGRHFDIINWCFRHEPSIDPCRMQAFRQQEIVCIGTPDQAEGPSRATGWVDAGLICSWGRWAWPSRPSWRTTRSSVVPGASSPSASAKRR